MFKRMFLLATVLFALLSQPVWAQQQKRSFIRDAEVENIIRTFATPLFEAAGLDPQAVRIFLIVDPSLNAFVAGGQNMFFHTGLLIRAERPAQLIGVIAHETGHIAGGHLARINDAMGNASTEALIAMLLGAAAGAASGRGDVAGAVIMGGSHIAERDLLTFSRTQESSADQAGLSYLEATGQSARGMKEFFDILGDQELLVSARQDPYVRTHPLTRERVSMVESFVARSAHSDVPDRPEYVQMHKRMRAKLFAFLEPPSRTFLRYKENDASIEARYARAIAAYRKPDLATALSLIDGLIAERPTDPYFWELKGQMLFENGRGQEALEPYRKAVEYLPDSALLRIGLAQVLTESGDPATLEEAVRHLQKAIDTEPGIASAWRLLTVAYNGLGEEGMLAYAMAELSVLEGRLPDARFHIGKAERLLPPGGSVWLRLQDLKQRTEQMKKEERKNKKR